MKEDTRIASSPTPKQTDYTHDHSESDFEMDDLARKVLGGTALTTAGLLLSRSLTLLTYLVLARLAAPEVFGVFAAGSIAVGAGTMLVDSRDYGRADPRGATCSMRRSKRHSRRRSREE